MLFIIGFGFFIESLIWLVISLKRMFDNLKEMRICVCMVKCVFIYNIFVIVK